MINELSESIKRFCQNCIKEKNKDQTECMAVQCELYRYKDGQACQCGQKFIRYEPQGRETRGKEIT